MEGSHFTGQTRLIGQESSRCYNPPHADVRAQPGELNRLSFRTSARQEVRHSEGGGQANRRGKVSPRRQGCHRWNVSGRCRASHWTSPLIILAASGRWRDTQSASGRSFSVDEGDLDQRQPRRNGHLLSGPSHTNVNSGEMSAERQEEHQKKHMTAFAFSTQPNSAWPEKTDAGTRKSIVRYTPP
ncbi:hypothetical protein SKAU_G00381140 [Synaphobranchus kaupii]|uniref:Uncharacterized protein n=1 Tax=Synaphobranchus kaupii TaxID=118154 RepID=A0A9Q1EDP1_SYNKA|nr:hypothetical protein SKAU_G00381140 [Synaphobranchus kaupii]